VIRSEETIAIEFERKLRDLMVEHPGAEAFLVQINPRVTAQFTGQGSRVLHALEAQTGRSFHFEGSEGLALDHFAITFQGTREEVEERALPFREGDEVLVDIVEPHMYDVDDAVAKLDGYIISIAGAARNVGEKRMVRIETVGRTAATALLLDESGEVIRPAPRPAARPAAKRPRRRSKPVARAGASEAQAGEQEQEALDGEATPSQPVQEPLPEPEQQPVANDQPEDGQESADAGGEDDLQSKPRRRGRRGGRRRSAAKAQATSE
jgi:ribonuclease G